MNRQHSSFRNIMKSTTIFGGTQLIVMLINVIRGKLVAVLLGAYGMGINALLQSTLQPIQMLFSLGMPQSAVSIISSAKASDEAEHLHKTVKSFRRVLLVMSVLSIFFMLSFAPWLNDLTMSSKESFTKWFMVFGLAAFFMIQTAGNNAILQGCRSIKRIAICNIAGPVSGLIISVPLYYFLEFRGIAISIILTSAVVWAVSQWHVNKLQLGKVKLSWRDSYSISKPIVQLGLTMMISGLLGNLSVYIINTFIRSVGNFSDVGFYQASINITTQCTALVFTALATDYLPKLAELRNKIQIRELLEQEGEVVLLVCAPISTLLIIFAPQIIRILLTQDFLIIIPVVQMMAVTFMMRAIHFPLDYLSVAQNDKTFFFWTEGIISNLKTLLIFMSGYYLFGIIGLGYASLVNGITDIIFSFVLIPWRFGVMYKKAFFYLITVELCLVAITLSAAIFLQGWPAMLVMGISCAIVIAYSFRELNKRLDIIHFLSDRIHR